MRSRGGVLSAILFLGSSLLWGQPPEVDQNRAVEEIQKQMAALGFAPASQMPKIILVGERHRYEKSLKRQKELLLDALNKKIRVGLEGALPGESEKLKGHVQVLTGVKNPDVDFVFGTEEELPHRLYGLLLSHIKIKNAINGQKVETLKDPLEKSFEIANECAPLLADLKELAAKDKSLDLYMRLALAKPKERAHIKVSMEFLRQLPKTLEQWIHHSFAQLRQDQARAARLFLPVETEKALALYFLERENFESLDFLGIDWRNLHIAKNIALNLVRSTQEKVPTDVYAIVGNNHLPGLQAMLNLIFKNKVTIETEDYFD